MGDAIDHAVRVGDYEIDKGLVLALRDAVKDWLREKDRERKEEKR